MKTVLSTKELLDRITKYENVLDCKNQVLSQVPGVSHGRVEIFLVSPPTKRSDLLY